MPIALEITLILVLVAVTIGLVPLLFQLRRTARALDVFLVSARSDLSQIADDVHASRVRMDHLATSLQRSLDDLASFTLLMRELGQMLKDFRVRFHTTIDTATRNLGGIIGGISAVLAFFKHQKNPRNDPPPESRS